MAVQFDPNGDINAMYTKLAYMLPELAIVATANMHVAHGLEATVDISAKKNVVNYLT